MTSQGNPRAVFKRAVEHKNLLVAEVTAREIGIVTLEEALSLVVLAAEVRPEKLDAYARRWIGRLATERSPKLAELDLAVTALRALPSPVQRRRSVSSHRRHDEGTSNVAAT